MQSEEATTIRTTTQIRIASQIHSGGNLDKRSSGIHSRLDVCQSSLPRLRIKNDVVRKCRGQKLSRHEHMDSLNHLRPTRFPPSRDIDDCARK